MYVGLNLLSAVISGVDGYLSTWISQKFLVGLRTKVFGHVLAHPSHVHDRNRLGDTMSRLTSDTAAVESFMIGQFATGTGAVLRLGDLRRSVVLAAVAARAGLDDRRSAALVGGHPLLPAGQGRLPRTPAPGRLAQRGHRGAAVERGPRPDLQPRGRGRRGLRAPDPCDRFRRARRRADPGGVPAAGRPGRAGRHPRGDRARHLGAGHRPADPGRADGLPGAARAVLLAAAHAREPAPGALLGHRRRGADGRAARRGAAQGRPGRPRPHQRPRRRGAVRRPGPLPRRQPGRAGRRVVPDRTGRARRPGRPQWRRQVHGRPAAHPARRDRGRRGPHRRAGPARPDRTRRSATRSPWCHRRPR